MAKLNYNRPCFNKNLGIRAYQAPKQFKPLGSTHIGHELIAIKTASPHYGKLQCNTCNKFVKWLSFNDYMNYV